MIEIKTKIHSFVVPAHVVHVTPPGLRQDGFNPTGVPKTLLSDLDAETLDELCRQFRHDVFAEAGIDDEY